ncbi:MAG: redox-regulated ATPase YchF [Planctomycetes bacterium]|nr:redox-regulated ATPase YchF [Planctomycetota bacterium]
MAERGPAARAAIIGTPGAGKTSLFCALSGMEYARAVAAAGRVMGAAVRILDPRLLEAHEKNGPHKKLIAPSVEFLDTPPIEIEEPGRPHNPGVFAHLREADGFVVVLRAYDAGEDRRRAAAAQLEALRSELYLADVDVMQKRIEKLRGELKKPGPAADESRKEMAVLERLSEAVAGGDVRPVLELKEEDEKKLRGFQFFSRKTLIPVVNIAETDLADPPRPTPDAICVALKLEAELLAMEEADRTSFMRDYGLSALTLPGLAAAVYDRLGFQTFLTLGDRDTTGWALRKGSTAWDAAGKIHTDIQRGFIHCEVVSFEDFRRHKSAHDAAAHGKQRIEGKAHPLVDFDIINIKTAAR